jgi:catechol 2,3-dioxygenase-like lactoylglutathione lyase family enzyme
VLFQIIGIAVSLWLGVGLLVGIAYVATRPALFFSAGFRWGAMARTVLITIPFWPVAFAQILRGEKHEERLYEREQANKSRQAVEMYRFQLRQGDWYRDVLGLRRKWLTDGFGRHYDPDEVGHEVDRIREPDFACRNGEWTDGPCPLCGAPEKGTSVCGMLRTEFTGVPQYTPPARLMRQAPETGFILAVSNDGPAHVSFIERESDHFHEVRFERTGEGLGHWVDRDGQVVDGLHGWWTLPELSRTQSSDGLEEPHRWRGETPPEPYDSNAAWDAALGRSAKEPV